MRLSIKLAAAVSVASAVAGVAGYGGVDEVLPAPRVQLVPFPQERFRFFPGYSSANGVPTIETGVGADDALVVARALAPLSPGVPPPDFQVPQGPGRLGVLEPPKQFLHWTDHLEIVLPPADVFRRCETAGVRAAPGEHIHGCSYIVAGRCLIIRVDDPGVARHELAHCNGWTHPEHAAPQTRPERHIWVHGPSPLAVLCMKQHHDASHAEPRHLTIRKPTGRQRCVNV